MSDHPDRFQEFLRRASAADSGKHAAQEVLGVSLSEYAAMFLGEGEWTPSQAEVPSAGSGE